MEYHQSRVGEDRGSRAAAHDPIQVERQNSLLLDVEQAAAFYGVSLRTFYSMRARGEVPPPIQLSSRVVRYRRSDLVDAVQRLQAGMPAPEPAQFSSPDSRAKRAAARARRAVRAAA